ncbi:hypothetical protein [Nostoc sp.]
MAILTIIPSTVALVQISGQQKACTNGLGRAKPEVLIRNTVEAIASNRI